ncbi:MAG: phosphotransferase [Planctomycetaceae bacterium]|nr:phosphotransferase [Planctomycetaceae bacterium]
MLLLDEHNTSVYLRQVGWVEPTEPLEVQVLAGGVSNQVLYIARPRHPGGDFVVKQVREQLRVPEPWFSRIDRIWREVEVMHVCDGLLSHDNDPSLRVHTPRILHEDRAQYVFAMTAAPREHRVWKRDLLAERVEPEIARQCGRLLGRLHARSWNNAAVAARLDDRAIFDELRLDPYYRTVAQRHPADAPLLERLVDSVLAHRRALVHADFSPKNLLLSDAGLLMVDFETGHYGDPAFDLGFFLSHLMLKATHFAPRHEPYLELSRAFWRGYRSELWPRIPSDESAALEARGVLNFAGCSWARVDGKSQVEYLTDERRRDLLRQFSRGLLRDPPHDWSTVLARFTDEVAKPLS